MNDRIVTAAVLVIGNEILSGRTKDANLNYLATELTAIGVRLTEARVVADVPEAIVKAVNELRAAYDYVFTTGGIGPTHDDITVGMRRQGVRRDADQGSARGDAAHQPLRRSEPDRGAAAHGASCRKARR